MKSLAGVITVSDRSSLGEREDRSGPLLLDLLSREGMVVVERRIVPDEEARIREALFDLIETHRVHLIITTGGTGIGPRDVTPEATRDIIEKELPGIVEYMRYMSMKKTPHGMLSRALAGVREETLIINFPGSPKAVEECFFAILPALSHALSLIRGEVGDCSSWSKGGTNG